MIDMMTRMPPEGCTHNRGHKQPFTVAEIFGCEVSQINDLFFIPPPEKAQLTQVKASGGDVKEATAGGATAIKKMMADDSNSEDEDDDGSHSSHSSDEDQLGAGGQADSTTKPASPVRGKKVRKSLKGSLVAHGYDEDGGGCAQEMPTVYQDSDEDDEVQVEVEDDSN